MAAVGLLATGDVAVKAVPVGVLLETGADTFSVDAVVEAVLTGFVPN